MPIKSKKILKIVLGVIIFFTLPSFLFFGFLYFKYNEDLPTGIEGKKADTLAYKMLEALNYEAYENTDYIEWTFKKRRHYKWKKSKNICEVYWKEHKVNLDLKNYSNSKVYIHGFIIESDLREELIEKAIKYFNNDSFWLVAPYKVFDAGVARKLVTLEDDSKALLVTYTKGGNTPGDSYLWLLDKTYKPKAFKIWASVLPINGLEASWSNWTALDSGIQLPTFHKLLFLGIEITDIKSLN
ncbi:hypothetical protein [Thalassobellus suaedae]|uniref:Uncharacterized protein n=1 Tax=Thalassobellus suaedae TaxID=3074124 RepID=A0ABY9XWT1_9FLAO|nr:hypothetical protein RHP51_07110 [Flavobacteriaceae bacterium HL-DH14]